ncbi:MAG: hypothetical protein GF349_02640 [Candidatus Magasanikbacteria bacterium]|nr:hypothetical protein [Candidatus Magasanikbacteria bacterium]
MKKILFIVAGRGFRLVEYEKPKEVLENADMKVYTGSDVEGEAESAESTKVKVDVTLEDIKANDYDGIFLVGGPGALEHLDNQKVYNIMTQAEEAGKFYGAICISPRILAKAGVLENKKATGWNGDRKLEGILNEYGASYKHKGVVIDGNLITGSGPDAAILFGETIAKQLS